MPLWLVAIGQFIWSCIKPFGNPMTWPALLLVFGVGFCKGDGYRDRQWLKDIAAERAAQEKITKQADEDAARELERWLAEQERIDALNAELDKEAADDPVAKRGSLSPAAVLRINRARAGRSK